MTPDQLKAALTEQGFTIGSEQLRNRGIRWYAYRRMNAAPDCTSNDKPPSLIVWPFHLAIDGRDWYSTEFEITGQINGTDWITSRIYSVPMDECLDTLPRAERVLTSVWNTAATVITTGEPQ